MSNKVRGTSVKVFPNGIVVHGSCCGHKQVPDGMGKWNDAIALEEHNSQAVNQTPAGELLKTVCVSLSIEARERVDVTWMRQGQSHLLSPQRAPGFLCSKCGMSTTLMWRHKTNLTRLIPLGLEYPLAPQTQSDHRTHSRLHRTK